MAEIVVPLQLAPSGIPADVFASLPVSTKLEMIGGRKELLRNGLNAHDMNEQARIWLQRTFSWPSLDCKFEFIPKVIGRHTVLYVVKISMGSDINADLVARREYLFQLEEPTIEFVSPAMYAKLLLVLG